VLGQRGCVGVDCYDVMVPFGAFSQQPVAGEAGATKADLLPVVRPGLVGVDAAEHLVPSCSVHHDVLPCRS
jgi:hypothetical protein